jgi:hypothetical protein
LNPKEVLLAIAPLISRERKKSGVTEVGRTYGKGGKNKGKPYGGHVARIGGPCPPKAAPFLELLQKGA